MGKAHDLLIAPIENPDPIVDALIERLSERARQTAELLATERLQTYEELILFLGNTEQGKEMSTLTAVLAGPMRSAKTFVGIAVGEHFEELGWSVMYAKSLIDTRDDTMKSYNGCKTSSCVRFETEEDEILLNPDLLVIDEVQFINDLSKLKRVLEQRETDGRRTLLCMLDENFKRENWFQYLWAAEHIQEKGGLLFQFGAICEQCGKRATRTQREIAMNGGEYRPASLTDPVVLVEEGGSEKYSARCTDCHRLLEDSIDL